mgnify:CR=1 FL=1
MVVNLSTIGWIARILVIVGALVWGLVVLGVTDLFGTGTLADVVYELVGLAGIWELIALFK